MRALRSLPKLLRNQLRSLIHIKDEEKLAPSAPEDVGGDVDGLMKYVRFCFSEVDRVYQNRVDQLPEMDAKLTCKGSGCSWCCYDYAAVFPPEMLVVIDAFRRLSTKDQAHVVSQNAQWLEAHKEIMDALPVVGDSHEQMGKFFGFMEHNGIDATRTMIGMTTSKSFFARTPCSFLKDGACLIYDDRPMACRGHNSIDPRSPEDSCREVLHKVEQVRIRRFDMSDAVAHFVHEWIGHGLPQFPNGELNAVFGRWLEYQASLSVDGKSAT